MIQLMLPLADDGCVKDTVVSLLHDHRGLSAKELWYKIKRVKNVSYHGVYKAVCELRDGGVLEKDKTKYSLSRRWICSLKMFVVSIERRTEVMRVTR